MIRSTMGVRYLTETLRRESRDIIGVDSFDAGRDCVIVNVDLEFDVFIPLIRPAIGPYAEGGEQDLPDDFKTTPPDAPSDEGPDDSFLYIYGLDPQAKSAPRASVTSILTVPDSKQRSIVQRAASRGLVTLIEGVDGYKYCFNNAWVAKDADGSRFSYICQDSMQNKDRHANGFARTQKHLKTGEERGPRKPTYDCRGTVSVKFSAKSHMVSVQYKHYCLHSVASQRESLPRSKPVAPVQQQGSQVLKRKRDSSSMVPPNDAPTPTRSWPAALPQPPPRPGARPLSLFELLQQSAIAQQAESQLANTQQPWWGGS